MENHNITGEVINIVSPLQAETYGWEKNNEKVDSRLQVISINDIKGYAENDGITLLNITNPYQGQILIRHPFLPNTYIDAKYSQDQLFQEKVDKVSEILQYLGVKCVFGQAKWTQTKRRELDIKGGGSVKVVEFSGEYKKQHNVEDCSSIKMEKTYPNAILTQDLYNKAAQKAKSYGLYDQTRSFIESRNPELGSNVQGTDYLTIELTKEINDLMSIAFSLSYLPAFKINANYKETLEIVNKVEMNIFVNFETCEVPEKVKIEFENEAKRIKRDSENAKK